VDDRDGMWTVKADVEKIKPIQVDSKLEEKKKLQEQKKIIEEEPVADSWEDMMADTPVTTPAASPTAASHGGMKEDWEAEGELVLPPSPTRMMPPRRLESLTEEDEVRTKTSRPVKLSERAMDQGEDDDVRCSGTPKHVCQSPVRQQALANAGLIDDLDLGEDGEATFKLDASAIDSALDAAARPEAPRDVIAAPLVPRQLACATPPESPEGSASGDSESDEEDDSQASGGEAAPKDASKS